MYICMHVGTCVCIKLPNRYLVIKILFSERLPTHSLISEKLV
jgi:hypothetical protein